MPEATDRQLGVQGLEKKVSLNHHSDRPSKIMDNIKE